MGYLVQYLELPDDVTIDAATVIGTMKVRAKSGDVFLLIYSGLVNVADTNNRGRLGLSETNDGVSTFCQMSTNNTSDYHSLAGGYIVEFAGGDFEVRLDASTIG